MVTRANQVCLRCRQQKRKCDKLLPICSLCKRLNRTCSYPAQNGSPGENRSRPFYVPDLLDLTPSNVSLTLEGQVSSVVGDGLQLEAMAATYFRTIHTWLPVISEDSYYNQISQARVQLAPSDLSLLTLCMFLVCAIPVDGDILVQTRALYTQLKSFTAMLEALGINSLRMLQCRLLLTVFEVGHAMYPSAYISTGASVRAAVALGANESSSEQLVKVFGAQRAEEARRTWQGIAITDRYASLVGECSPFRGLSLSSGTIDGTNVCDFQGIGNHLPEEMDPLTKLSQASWILEQVLAHVRETTPHPEFIIAEALQLLKTMTSFLGAFQDGGPAHSAISNSSIAVCRSAMLVNLEFGSHIKQPDSEFCSKTGRNMLDSLIDEIVHGATLVLPSLPGSAVGNLPVFIPHYIHKAAVVLIRDFRGSGPVEPSVRTLTSLLRHIGRRWTAGRRYAEDIEQMALKVGRYNATNQSLC